MPPNRRPFAPIFGNKTPRKELSLLEKGKIAGQAQLGLTARQIELNLEIPRTIIQFVLGRLTTTPTGVNKARLGRPLIITPRAQRSLIR